GVDGADRLGNAGAEPRPREVRLGRVPERQLCLAEPDHGGGARHRLHRLPPRSRDALAAARGVLGQDRDPALTGLSPCKIILNCPASAWTFPPRRASSVRSIGYSCMCSRASSSRSSATPAVASPPCSTSSPACCRPPAA